MARLAIAGGFLAERAKLERSVQTAVQAMIAEFTGHEYTGCFSRLSQSAGERRVLRRDAAVDFLSPLVSVVRQGSLATGGA